MLLPIGEERDHFGYDAIRDRYVDEPKERAKSREKGTTNTENKEEENNGL